jgi:PEP-CTERM motif
MGFFPAGMAPALLEVTEALCSRREMMRNRGFKYALVVAALSAFSSMASADFIQTFEGNDCSGVFGQGFANCKIPANIDPNESPIIIKFDEFNATNGTFGLVEINDALFPSIDGSEFAFVFTTGDGGTGTWTYTPGPDDPLINFFVAKGGPNFNLFSNLGDPNSDAWATPTNPNNNQPFGLSHLSFYDEGREPTVAEPGSLALLGAGLLGLAGLTRRRNAGR